MSSGIEGVQLSGFKMTVRRKSHHALLGFEIVERALFAAENHIKLEEIASLNSVELDASPNSFCGKGFWILSFLRH